MQHVRTSLSKEIDGLDVFSAPDLLLHNRGSIAAAALERRGCTGRPSRALHGDLARRGAVTAWLHR